MTTAQTFSEQYDALQCQWRQDAIHRKRHYLRYLAPCGSGGFCADMAPTDTSASRVIWQVRYTCQGCKRQD